MKNLYKKNKQNIFILVLAAFVFISILIIRFSNSEDYWACKNGLWVKHGKPSSSQPVSNCLVSNSNKYQPPEVVEIFYNWYFQSNKKDINFKTVEGLDYFSSNFKKFISTKSFMGKNNPFTCQNDLTVSSYNAYLIYEKKDKAMVTVYQNYIDHQDKLDFILKKNKNIWQIDSVQCTKLLEATKKLGQSYN